MYRNLYWKWNKKVAGDLCEYFVNSVDWDATGTGLVYSKEDQDFVDDPMLRKTDTVFVDSFSPLGCILQTHVAIANREAEWRMRIDSMQNVQIGRYEKDGFYEWHSDSGVPDEMGQIRKLSVVMMLSDSSDYEGGVLEIEDLDTPLDKLEQGDIIVFPSYLKHRVTPVTAGVRYSAVGWCVGPQFT